MDSYSRVVTVSFCKPIEISACLPVQSSPDPSDVAPHSLRGEKNRNAKPGGWSYYGCDHECVSDCVSCVEKHKQLILLVDHSRISHPMFQGCSSISSTFIFPARTEYGVWSILYGARIYRVSRHRQLYKHWVTERHDST